MDCLLRSRACISISHLWAGTKHQSIRWIWCGRSFLSGSEVSGTAYNTVWKWLLPQPPHCCVPVFWNPVLSLSIHALRTQFHSSLGRLLHILRKGCLSSWIQSWLTMFLNIKEHWLLMQSLANLPLSLLLFQVKLQWTICWILCNVICSTFFLSFFFIFHKAK